MAKLIGNNQVQLNDGTIKSVKQGEWYDAQHYFNGTLGAAGVVNDPNAVGYGNKVSNEVISQTNPANVSYIDSQIKADQLKAPVSGISYTSSNPQDNFVSGLTEQVNVARTALESTLSTQKTEVDTKLASLRQKEQDTLAKVQELSTPFREELEKTQREKLHIDENFEANQTLVNELDQLLTEGNNLIKQQQEVTGLASVRNPRIQKTMDDVAARAGVIQAVMSARNGQIAQAETLIDRTVNAITADRNDQISYYETILNLNNRDIVSLDTDSKKNAEEQLNLKKSDLASAQATADYVKQLLLNPTTAGLMGEAGVKLNDSIEQINTKLSQAVYSKEVKDLVNGMAKEGNSAVLDPNTVPAGQLITVTDSRGQKYYFKKAASSSTDTAAYDFLTKNFNVSPTDISPTTANTDLNSIINSVVAPNVSPKSGIGSILYDTLGRKWQYQSSGWVLIG